MKHSPPGWEQLAGLASKVSGVETPVNRLRVEEITAAAMKNASLRTPGIGVVLLGWLGLPKVWLPLVLGALLLGGWGLQGQFSPERRAAERYEGWAGATLRQLKAWYPLECEDAGEIGLLMQRRVEELKQSPSNSGKSRELISATERDLLGRLTPEQRVLFAAEQARLRERWFPAH